MTIPINPWGAKILSPFSHHLKTFAVAAATAALSACGSADLKGTGSGADIQSLPTDFPMLSTACNDGATSQSVLFCHRFFANHRRIVDEAEKEYFQKYGRGGTCALTQSTALELTGTVSFGFERPASTLKLERALVTGGTFAGVNYGRGKGWKLITDCTDLRAGDIVLTRPATPLRPNDRVPFHSFMFVQWANAQKTRAWSLDYKRKDRTTAAEKAYVRWVQLPEYLRGQMQEPVYEFQGHHLCWKALRPQ